MPRRDQSGPLGEGQMSGRGMGCCSVNIDNKPVGNSSDIGAGENVGAERGLGRGAGGAGKGMGLGRGAGGGAGKGMGLGRGAGRGQNLVQNSNEDSENQEQLDTLRKRVEILEEKLNN